MVASDEYLLTMSSDDISSLSDTKEKVLSLLSIFPTILSVAGSSIIIHLVIHAKKRTPYRRILFATSCCDIVSSIGYMLQPFLMPSDTSQWIWAIGNEATCTALGTIAQFGFASHWYSGMLSFNFLLSVRFGMKEEVFAKQFEPWMHAFIMLFSIATATSGAAIGFYNPVTIGPGCWVKGYPEGCGTDPGEAQCKSPLIAWIFGGIPSLLMFICIVVNNLLIYFHVRGTIMRGHKRSSAIHRLGANSIMQFQLKRVKAVGTQSFLYVGAYLLSFVWTCALRTLESLGFDGEDQDSLLPLLLLQALFLPSQGFFNVFIFVRPQYLRCRRDFHRESRVWCARRALYGDDVVPTKETQRNVPTAGTDQPSSLVNLQRRSFEKRIDLSGAAITAERIDTSEPKIERENKENVSKESVGCEKNTKS